MPSSSRTLSSSLANSEARRGGIIENASYSLTRPQYGDSETATVLESSFRGSRWQSGTKIERFERSWSGSDSPETNLISTTVKQCI